jgi:hypothetical protein
VAQKLGQGPQRGSERLPRALRLGVEALMQQSMQTMFSITSWKR